MSDQNAVNQTIKAFGHPGSLVKAYGAWVVLARSKQATLGALVLACREEALAFSQISDQASRELPKIIKDIEAGLSAFRRYQKINYLMLMMVDPHVHFHVLPRYDSPQDFEGTPFSDPGWPAVPDLSAGPLLEGEALERLVAALKSHWPE